MDNKEAIKRVEEMFGSHLEFVWHQIMQLSLSGELCDVTFYKRKPAINVKIDQKIMLLIGLFSLIFVTTITITSVDSTLDTNISIKIIDFGIVTQGNPRVFQPNLLTIWTNASHYTITTTTPIELTTILLGITVIAIRRIFTSEKDL